MLPSTARAARANGASMKLSELRGLADGPLLARFFEAHDDAAFTVLIERYGPLVFGVCRRILTDANDAEDAFQATFLVLVRKGGTLRDPGRLASWLYGVAYQTALKARQLAARRLARERQMADMPEPAARPHEPWHDLQPILDDELSRLPDIYRVVVLLCDLEGKTRKEAARQLGVPEGTVAGRLARARALLAKRLTRRGLTLSGGALAALYNPAAPGCFAPPWCGRR